MLWWVLAFVIAAATTAAAVPRLARRAGNRAATRTVHRFRARIDRFKLTSKSYISASLMGDERIAAAVRTHAAEKALPESQVWRQVERYIDEIVPFFNIVAYYRFGYSASRILLNLFYKVSVEHERATAIEALPRESIVIYLINHRSNADYVLVGYALAGQVSISYAVGEWARAFPLEYIFKTFGSYFVRRRYREPLYHTVLERYVQLITRNGVTQGIFPEGGLTRDGRLRPAKIGLLDYVLGVAREPGYAERMYIVPVALNYDRVLEDRTLLRELDAAGSGRRPSRLSQLREVSRYLFWNLSRVVARRWRRYGRAAVTIGTPIPLAPWFSEQGGGALFALPRPERLARVQKLCDDVMRRIGEIVPVTAVSLACAAVQSLEADFVPRHRLLSRMEEMRDVLVELDARILGADHDVAGTLERAERMLTMRRVLVREGDGYAVLPRGRPLISFYANGISHLLGPFERGVRERDTLPADRFVGM